ncbi:uncharacterized protein N7482_002528 [Penicillium canariense]|uniref:Uncharacterized protein n=1 Tax=Penicillium canariense TaxID=189055 RepID=A0A9W9ILY0_9EURO|nr:uncharacterized protein N7482_002528 [Penicillium canariense]KAJ5176651.1 hypothetical protein N7482_002528 [Penicillium canariense]
MFGRRKRSSSHHQPLSAPASQSAQSAASHAFLKSQPSSSSLSSAAAAAALRTLSPTPTSVENVQTKRMANRRASMQSPTNLAAGRRSASVSGPLRRTNSSSSMTARTFREPSPNRPSTSSGPADQRDVPVDVPPLPSLPTKYVPKYVPRNGPNRRAVSMDPAMRSPPASPRARGANVDRAQDGVPAILPSTHGRINSLGTVPETDRPSSRNSINFSYPMGARAISPTSPLENQMTSLDPASVREVPSEEEPSMRQPGSENSGNTGSRTHAVGMEGSRASKPAGASVSTAVAAAQAVSGQKSSPKADPGTPALSSQERRIDHTVPVTDSGSQGDPPTSRPVPERWPSTVFEENETEVEVDAGISATRCIGDRLANAPPTVSYVDAVSTPQPSPQPSPKAGRETTPQQEAHFQQSSSPGRSARFAKWLSVSASGDQVHQPPPRSVSPVKSALKAPRGSSLSPDRKGSTMGGRVFQPPSEISDGTSVASDEGSRIGVKKRPVKVSFDDEAEIVGVAASPPTSPEENVPESPPNKGKSRMSWLGVGKKRVSPLDFVSGDDDFDKVMKPRPALPSFGSVRGIRDGGNPAPAIPDFSDNDSTSSSDNDVAAPGLSFSNDHALGGILPKALQKEPAKTRGNTALEQLSVSGGPLSSQQTSAPEPKLGGVAIGSRTDKSSLSGPNAELPVPSIAVEPATPPVDSGRPILEQRSSLDCHIPGGFPASKSDRNLQAAASAASADTVKPQPVASAVPQLDDVDTEGESGDSVYSDAAEDIDGDGFGSINAIVESRAVPRSTGPMASSSESRDATPRAVDRTAAIESQSQGVTGQGREDPRSITPTQDSVNRQMSESPVSPSGQRESDSTYSPLPTKSNARAPSSQNGTIQTDSTKQSRPMSVDARGGSGLQDPSVISNKATKDKNRPVSLGPAFQMKRNNGASAEWSSSLRRTTSSGSDSSSSFKRASPSARSEGPLSMRRTMRASSTQPRVHSPSDRANSPDDRRPLSSGSGAGTMRRTLRSPGAGNERYSFFSTNNKAPRALFTKAPPKSMRGASRFVDSDGEGDGAQPQTFHSRFADSSDEDEPGSNTLRPVRGIPRRQGAYDGDSTDLEDSSEEERQLQAAALAAHQPVSTPPGSRGKHAPNMSGFAAVAKQRGMSQRELEEFLMQPPGGRKPSLLTRLGLKRPKFSDNRIRKADVESPSRRDTPLERSRLEREHLRGENFVNGDRGVVTTVTAGAPQPAPSRKLNRRLSKRNTISADHWPLRPEPRDKTPEPIPEHSQSLPSSPLQATKPAGLPAADAERNGSITVNGGDAPGTISTIKEEPEPPQASQAGPDVNDAGSDVTRTTAEEQGLSARDVVIAGSGRKKRFPLFRKAFGLRK